MKISRSILMLTLLCMSQIHALTPIQRGRIRDHVQNIKNVSITDLQKDLKQLKGSKPAQANIRQMYANWMSKIQAELNTRQPQPAVTAMPGRRPGAPVPPRPGGPGFPPAAPAPAIEPAIEPVAEPAIEPVAEPAIEPVAEPVAEPAIEPSATAAYEPAEAVREFVTQSNNIEQQLNGFTSALGNLRKNLTDNASILGIAENQVRTVNDNDLDNALRKRRLQYAQEKFRPQGREQFSGDMTQEAIVARDNFRGDPTRTPLANIAARRTELENRFNALNALLDNADNLMRVTFKDAPQEQAQHAAARDKLEAVLQQATKELKNAQDAYTNYAAARSEQEVPEIATIKRMISTTLDKLNVYTALLQSLRPATEPEVKEPVQKEKTALEKAQELQKMLREKQADTPALQEEEEEGGSSGISPEEKKALQEQQKTGSSLTLEQTVPEIPITTEPELGLSEEEMKEKLQELEESTQEPGPAGESEAIPRPIGEPGFETTQEPAAALSPEVIEQQVKQVITTEEGGPSEKPTTGLSQEELTFYEAELTLGEARPYSELPENIRTQLEKMDSALGKLDADLRPNYYVTLNIPMDANNDVIKKAYRQLMLLYHPDRNMDRQEWAKEQAQRITAAYEVLSDAEERSKHDETLRGLPSSSEPIDPLFIENAMETIATIGQELEKATAQLSDEERDSIIATINPYTIAIMERLNNLAVAWQRRTIDLNTRLATDLEQSERDRIEKEKQALERAIEKTRQTMRIIPVSPSLLTWRTTATEERGLGDIQPLVGLSRISLPDTPKIVPAPQMTQEEATADITTSLERQLATMKENNRKSGEALIQGEQEIYKKRSKQLVPIFTKATTAYESYTKTYGKNPTINSLMDQIKEQMQLKDDQTALKKLAREKAPQMTEQEMTEAEKEMEAESSAATGEGAEGLSAEAMTEAEKEMEAESSAATGEGAEGLSAEAMTEAEKEMEAESSATTGEGAEGLSAEAMTEAEKAMEAESSATTGEGAEGLSAEAMTEAEKAMEAELEKLGQEQQ